MVYISFGAFGYSCYGTEVPTIITMVLPDNAVSFLIKVGLCISLLFTYPLAMFPVFEIVEEHWLWNTMHPTVEAAEAGGERGEQTIELQDDGAGVATLKAFIGSVPCNIMAFVLPTFFHLVICWDSMGKVGRG
eukprot:CAMPEP_0180182736 /NCGR_PEP_ID=MMETSP0986-20121125/40823_1 /TAXON_ID=697907 /ORGANISM="non described non described, Strain CCMP2293" /LENGTH=132 /DNA_ID=CAMNT_0022136121 /DNA_START=22 /DNA_END=416 /DNA_ORIENTATION=+